MLYKSQHLQRIIRETSYSESTGILVVLFISRRIAFVVLYVKVTLDYANCGAGLVHYTTTKTKMFWFASFTVVVMGKEHNISEANRQLGDTTYYKRLDQVQTSDHQRLVNEETLLVSLDVVSFDTNIPYEGGIEACREAWNTKQKRWITRPNL